MHELPTWAVAVLPPAVVIFMVGGWWTVKLAQKGKGVKPCPARPELERFHVQAVRQEEGFRSLCLTQDRLAGSIENLAQAVRESGDKAAGAVLRVAEMALKKESTDG